MSRGARLAATAGVAFVVAAVVIAVGAAPEPEQRPAPPRVYSSCLAVDTQQTPAGGDPCGGR
ncbi:hypothetical protein ACFYZN_29200 [Streptomyces sp. NPDC001777]|uniref:hypothetical protein n=1 Tax=Streptomyces sp. NPDC001777 TaxID=3364608 RepID=UPI003689B50B